MRRLVVSGAHRFIGLLALSLCTSCTLSQRGREATELIALYSHADCVAPVQPPSQDDFEPPRWSQTIELGTDLNATIAAFGFVHGRVTVRYSDESEERVVAAPGLYVYPYDLRVSSDKERLYAVAMGWAGALWHRTILYEYDLATRNVLREIRVAPELLPPRCPPVANNALKLTAAAQSASVRRSVEAAAAAAYGER